MKKKTNQKGFTLVELIVVLVILAILAAILVPALLGYIDRAKKQQIVLNAKSALTASQAEMSSIYGTGDALSSITSGNPGATRILETADIPKCKVLTIGTKAAAAGASSAAVKHASYVVTYVEYQEDGDPIYFNGTSWVETKPTGSYAPSKTYDIKK